jgi:general secretion pathway protein L
VDGIGVQPEILWAQIRSAWQWWTGELAGLIPPRLRATLSGTDDAFFIEVLDTEYIVRRHTGRRDAIVARIPRDAYAARVLRLSVPAANGWRRWLAVPVILQLLASQALSRTLRLPPEAKSNLAAILRHEVARQSPVDTATIYYDHRAGKAEDGALDVELRIVHREPVDAIVAALADAGIALSWIEFIGDKTRADGGNFPVSAAAARAYQLRPRIVPGLVALVLLLGALTLGVTYWRGEMVADDLAGRVAAARDDALAVDRLERRLDTKTRQYTFLAEQKQKPATIAVLAAVTRLLPDDAWLYQFELDGNEVRLHGFSATASSLIALFDSSPYFQDAQLRAPLVQGPKPGLQRFDISFKLKASGS